MAHIKTTLDDLSRHVAINLLAPLWQPIILLGAPGGGKTMWFIRELAKIYAKHLGIDVDEIGYVIEKPARRDAAELAGPALPCRDDDGSVYMDFTVSPLIRKIRKTGKKYGVVMFDEVAAAGAPEQKVCSDAFDPEENAIGGTELPDGWIAVGTGNRAQDKAGATRLLSQLTNRALVYELEFCMRGWAKWARNNGVNEVAIECAEAHAEQGFFVDAVPTEDGPYNTPRSYVRASHHLSAFMSTEEFTGTIPPFMERMLAANIGAEKAALLCQWVAQRENVPTGAEIIRNPETAQVPDQTGFQLIAANLAFAEVKDARTAEAALKYIVRLRTDLQVSLGTKLMRISTRAGWVVTDPLASAFIERFHDLLPLAAD